MMMEEEILLINSVPLLFKKRLNSSSQLLFYNHTLRLGGLFFHLLPLGSS